MHGREGVCQCLVGRGYGSAWYEEGMAMYGMEGDGSAW